MIEVVEPGALTTVQDAIGRRAWRHLGVPVGGAADPWSARLANRLVGNDDAGALLEMTMHGPVLRFVEPAVIALTGSLDGSVDGLPLARDVARVVRAGGLVRIGGGPGARGYLGVAGGLDVEPVLGSAATDLRSRFGGLGGRSLRRGDRLGFLRVAPEARRWIGSWEAGAIRIVDGPHPAGRRIDGAWRVAAEADRAGVRLEGAGLLPRQPEVPSMGLPLGAIQVPPDGRPIIMLADRPVTGGYPVPACVIGADIGRAAQLRPGDALVLQSVSLDEATQALRRAEQELAALQVLDAPPDDELRWVGSHR